MDAFLTVVMLTTGLAVIIGPFLAVRRWQGVWRVLALLPAGALAFVAIRIALDTAIDPTAHNLWPMELLLVGIPGLLFLGAVWLVRRLFASGESSAVSR
jgi:hypothetical protein